MIIKNAQGLGVRSPTNVGRPHPPSEGSLVVCAAVCLCASVCVFVRVCVLACLFVYVCVFVSECVCVRECVNVCVHVCA